MNRIGLAARCAALFFTLLAAGGPVAWAGADRLCVVPVKNGAPTKADLGATWRMVFKVLYFRASRFPIIHSLNRGGFWTISDDRAFIPYPGTVPGTFQHEFLENTDTGRVLGEQFGAWTILDRTSGEFRPFDLVSPQVKPQVLTWLYIPRWQRSLVATQTGAFFLDGNKMTPVTGTDRAAIGSVDKIVDLPRLQAVAFLTTDRRETESINDWISRVFLRMDDGRMFLVATGEARKKPAGWLSLFRREPEPDWASTRSESFSNVYEIASSNNVVIVSNRQTRVVPMNMENGKAVPGKAKIVAQKSRPDAFGLSRYIESLDQFLFYRRPKDEHAKVEPGIFRITRDGAERIAESEPVSLTFFSRVFESRKREFIVLRGADRLYVYDGKHAIAPIAGFAFHNALSMPDVYDLPHLGRVLVASGTEIYEITASNALKRLRLPAEMQGSHTISIIEMPASDAAIILTSNGLFALDRSGTIAPVRGQAAMKPFTRFPLSRQGVIPQRNELMITVPKGLFLVVDEAISGPGVCDRAAN